jgi:O-antigen ligase
MITREFAKANIWLGLGAGIAAVAWLLPNHSPPWPAFYNEFVLAAVFVPMAAWLILRSRAALVAPLASLVVLLLALVPAIQYACGQIAYSGDAVLASMYLSGTGLAIICGRRWRAVDPEQMLLVAWTTVTMAAILSVGAALQQWLRLDQFGVLVADLPLGGRPNGNVAQANHLATLLVWGLIGAWALHSMGRLRGGIALVVAVTMLFGIASTQSRTGVINVALVAIAALIWSRDRAARASSVLLLVSFILLALNWQRLNDTLLFSQGLPLSRQASGGARPLLWEHMLAAVRLSPWFGYGWTQVSLGHQAVALQLPSLERGVFAYAHNLWLDLALWNGLPVALAIGVALLSWFALRLKAASTLADKLLWLALLVLLVHAQFEFPYAYAYFLLPAGLMAGSIEVHTASRLALRFPRWFCLAVVAAMSCVLAALVVDYRHIEQDLLDYRFAAARIGDAQPHAARGTLVLTQWSALISFALIEPRPGMADAELDGMQKVAARFPSNGNQFRAALAAARNGRPVQAAGDLRLLCAVYTPERCEKARIAWEAISEQDPAIRATPFPSR